MLQKGPGRPRLTRMMPAVSTLPLWRELLATIRAHRKRLLPGQAMLRRAARTVVHVNDRPLENNSTIYQFAAAENCRLTHLRDLSGSGGAAADPGCGSAFLACDREGPTQACDFHTFSPPTTGRNGFFGRLLSPARSHTAPRTSVGRTPSSPS
jgi:hypothetical protein